MTLQLETVLFNRDTSGGNPAALPVRAKASVGVPQVDWQRNGASGASATATAVAYPLTMSAGDVNDLRVTATFTATSTPSAAIFVRATGQDGRLLGDVVKTRITPGDIANPRQLQLDGVLLRNAAVGLHTVVWKWEQSADGNGGWQEFAESTHQVFVIVGQPEAPWGRPSVARRIVPWHEAMELACTWAAGKRTAAEVTEVLTETLDGLAGRMVGTKVVRYDQLGSLCGDTTFSVRLLLMIWRQQAGGPFRLNCRDLNTAVAINATVLGCPLLVVRLTPVAPAPKIQTNPIRLFSEQSDRACLFEFHEAATSPGQVIDQRQVWDACLRVDFDARPQTSPGDLRLPFGVAIHETRLDLGYRKRLLASGSQACAIKDVAGDGFRYPIHDHDDVPPFAVTDPYFRERREHFTRLMSQIPNSLPRGGTPTNALELFLKDNAEAEGFPRSLNVGEQLEAVVFTPLQAFTANNGWPESSAVQAASRAQAIEILATLAAEYNGTLEPRGVGDFALYDRDADVALMLRGLIVAEISGDAKPGATPTALAEASRLDDALNDFFLTPTPAV